MLVRPPSVVAASPRESLPSTTTFGCSSEDAPSGAEHLPGRGRRRQLTVQVADLAVLDCWKVTSKWWGPG